MFLCISIFKCICFLHLLFQYFSFPTKVSLFLVPLYHQVFQPNIFHGELHNWRARYIYPQIHYVHCSDWHKEDPQEFFDFWVMWNIITLFKNLQHSLFFTCYKLSYQVGRTLGFGIWEVNSKRQGKRPKQKGNWGKQQVAGWKPSETIFVLIFCRPRATSSLRAQTLAYHSHQSLQEFQNAQFPCYTTPCATPRGCPVSIGRR